ncbi:ferritin-like domain-containing protein [Chryseobacterium sp. NEB161]|nr:ferritin-like domain-containing protein [Chryseobacterium sp. NEB161]
MATKTENNSASAGKKEQENLSKANLQKQGGNQEQNMKDSSLHKFFVDALKDIYFAEDAILDALGKMESAATTEELKEAFEDHQLQTKKHISRLEKVFKLIDETPEKKECKAIVGIIKEGEDIINSTEAGSTTRDVGLIIAAQKVEHYEIPTYGGLVQLAITMNHDKAADLLDRTLEEEEETDLLLTEIAETSINVDAEQEDWSQF